MENKFSSKDLTIWSLFLAGILFRIVDMIVNFPTEKFYYLFLDLSTLFIFISILLGMKR